MNKIKITILNLPYEIYYCIFEYLDNKNKYDFLMANKQIDIYKKLRIWNIKRHIAFQYFNDYTNCLWLNNIDNTYLQLCINFSHNKQLLKLYNLSNIYKLNLSNSYVLTKIISLINIQYVQLYGNDKLNYIEHIENINTIDLAFCTNLQIIKKIKNVKNINCYGCTNLFYIDCIENVENLNISYCLNVNIKKICNVKNIIK